MENTKPTNEEKELTPKEIAEREKAIMDYYAGQAKILEKQKNYLSLLTEIDELNYRRLRAQIAYAQLMNGPQDSPESMEQPTQTPEVAKEEKVRKLKTQK
jgi:hypothetical protein